MCLTEATMALESGMDRLLLLAGRRAAGYPSIESIVQ
jgi:hypothetical protein